MVELVINNKKHVSTRLAAVLLNCTPDYAGKLARQGKITATWHNNQWFIEEASIQHYVRESALQKDIQRKELAKQREIEYRTRQESLKVQEKELAQSAVSVPSMFTVAKSLMVTACFVIAFALKFLAGNVALADTGVVEIAQHMTDTVAENAAQVSGAAEHAVTSVGNSVISFARTTESVASEVSLRVSNYTSSYGSAVVGGSQLVSNTAVSFAVALHDTGAKILHGYEHGIYAVAGDAVFVGESYVAGINSTGEGIYTALETVEMKRIALTDRIGRGVNSNIANASASLLFAQDKITSTYYGGLANISNTLRSLVDSYAEGVYAVGQSVIEIGRAYNRGVYAVADKITGIVDDEYYAGQLATHRSTATEKPVVAIVEDDDINTEVANTSTSRPSVIVRGISEEYLERRLAMFKDSLDLKSEVTVIRETIEGSRISTDRIYDDIGDSSNEAAENAVTGGDLSFSGIDGTFSGDVSIAGDFSVTGTTTLSGPLSVGGSVGVSGYVLQSTGTGMQWVATSTLGISGGGGGTWGSITGTLSAQTDLQTELDARLSTTTAASTYVAQTLTLNTLALTGDQTFATGTVGTDFGISSSGSVHTFNIPNASGSARGLLTSADWTTFNNKLSANSPIVGATKTKITYDASGLVTAGADATTADIADSLNRRYVTDAQLAVLGNTSGINTGDQTITLTGDVTGTGTGSFVATLANTGVSAGSYTNTNVTVDSKGRITAISNGAGGGGTWETLTGDQSTVNLSGFTDDVGFLTSESDPVYSGSSWFSTTNNASNWDTAYSWGDHSLAGYLTSESDPVYVASSWDTTTNNALDWDTAYSWGDHGVAGYAKLDGSNQPFTGDLEISKTEPRITLSDTGDSAAFLIDKLSANNKLRLVSQNRAFLPAGGVTATIANNGAPFSYTLSDFSVSFWIKTTDTAQNMFAGNAANNTTFFINYENGYFYLRVNGSTVSWPYSAATFANNTWHHVVFAIAKNGSSQVYVDGVSLGNVTAPNADAVFTHILRAGIGSGARGTFDEFIVFDSQINSTKVASLYQSGSPFKLTDYTGVYAAYHFDTGSGSIYYDGSGNGRDVTATTAPTWTTGTVSAGVEPTSDVEFLSLFNNNIPNSYGTTQLGYRNNVIGTTNIYEGLTHRFNILGTQVLGLSSAAVDITGTLTATSNITTSAGRVFSGSLGTAALPAFSLATDTDTGAWFPTANTFAVSTGGSERIRISSSGLVGIGTTGASEYLQIGDASGVSTSRRAISLGVGGYAVPANFNTASNGDKIILYRNASYDGSMGVGPTGDWWFKSQATSGNAASFDWYGGSAGGAPTLFARLNQAGNFSLGLGSTAASARFHVLSTTEQLRVAYDASNYFSTTVGSTGGVTFDAVGAGAGFTFNDAVKIASSTANTGLSVHYTGASGINYSILSCFNCGSAGLGGLEIYDTTNAAARAYIASGVNGWQTPSDVRLKSDIQELSVLDKINQVRGVSYILNDSGIPQIGVIAQEVKSVFPYAVSGSEEEGRYLGVNYGSVAAIALQGVRELYSTTKLFEGESVSLDSLLLDAEFTDIFAREDGDVLGVFIQIKNSIIERVDVVKELVVVQITALRAYVGDLFADKVTTNKLCIPDSNGVEVCLTGDQLRELLGDEAPEDTVEDDADTDENDDDNDANNDEGGDTGSINDNGGDTATDSGGDGESDTPVDEEGGINDVGTDDVVTPDADEGAANEASDDSSDTGSDSAPDGEFDTSNDSDDSGSDTSGDSSSDSDSGSDSASDSGDSGSAPTE